MFKKFVPNFADSIKNCPKNNFGPKNEFLGPEQLCFQIKF
jgi:hypothetical protein